MKSLMKILVTCYRLIGIMTLFLTSYRSCYFQNICLSNCSTAFLSGKHFK